MSVILSWQILRSDELSSATCSRLNQLTRLTCARALQSQLERRLPDRMNFLHQPRSPLLYHTAVLPQKSLRNIPLHLQSETSFCKAVSYTRPGCNHNGSCRNSRSILDFG